ncbi:glycosyltransferase family 4 protein [Bacillus pinisoli]|uniref:glycosyltransferase family 4 protein n=1 Tax=Bacillus pinisoli TaxID=2901866 RepID=UPI001FF677CB|nr:glycosyltransferase family 4 protein [Bacillus pinisoli]
MNIWIFNHYSNGPLSSGGTRHYDLAKELVKKGYQVTIFASSFAHQASEDTRITKKGEEVKIEQHEGIKFIWIKTEPYVRNNWRRVKNILDYSIRAYKYAKHLKEHPDIIIGSLMHPLAPVIAYWLAKKKKATFYFEERDLWPQTLIDIGGVSKYHPVVIALGLLEKFLYKQATKIIVLFHKAQDYVIGKGIEADKVLFLPNGVDLSRFDSVPSELPLEIEESLRHVKDKFIAIYTGSHGVSDYLDSLLWTAKIVKEKNDHIHFLFVGNGPEKEKLSQLKQELCLGNVTFLPSVLKEYIPTLLERADVGLISLKDAELYKWGISFNKQYDYMAASLPTILLSNRSEYHIEQSGGGVIVRSVEEMAEAILHLFHHENLRKELGENARRFVEDHHSWEVLSTKLISTFDDEKKTRHVEGR